MTQSDVEEERVIGRRKKQFIQWRDKILHKKRLPSQPDRKSGATCGSEENFQVKDEDVHV